MKPFGLHLWQAKAATPFQPCLPQQQCPQNDIYLSVWLQIDVVCRAVEECRCGELNWSWGGCRCRGCGGRRLTRGPEVVVVVEVGIRHHWSQFKEGVRRGEGVHCNQITFTRDLLEFRNKKDLDIENIT